MKYFKVRVVEQTVHQFIVKADTKEAVAAMDVDEYFADLCSDNAGFQYVNSRTIDDVHAVDGPDLSHYLVELQEDA